MRQIISLVAGMARRWSSMFATMTGFRLTISRSLTGRPQCAIRSAWDYRRVGVLDSVLRANLRWLSGIDILECPDRPWPVNSWGCLHEPDR